MFRHCLLTILVLLALPIRGQSKKNLPDQPKLVVGIVVDQMGYDFLVRYRDKFGAGGFRRLVQEGFDCRNTHYNYVPTYTAPGHTCVYTGSVPAVHGIVANDWYDRRRGQLVYCTDDSTAQTVGSSSTAGRMSPRNMLTTTVTDQLRLASNGQSKVIGLALKDRGAILPAGHTANAAYWFDSANGHWITSTYYMNDLPAWVKAFNDRRLPAQYLAQPWTLLLPPGQYAHSTADDQPFEARLAGENAPTFPHDLPKLRKADFELLRSTPFGNTLTKEFAVAALQHERLGQGEATDFLTVSFSSTDYVGHAFGPYSVEMEDTYLRLDRDIADLLTFLDGHVGQENVLVFLTADHGVAPVPAHARSLRVPGGVFEGQQIIKALADHLSTTLGKGEWIREYANGHIYLNPDAMRAHKTAFSAVLAEIETYLLTQPGVSRIVNLRDPSSAALPDYQLDFIKNGQYPPRSGDVMVLLNPGWMETRPQGTTHGSYFNYDTHVPLLWYGWKIKPGHTAARYSVADIAPTVADLLRILEPNGCVGNPILLPLR